MAATGWCGRGRARRGLAGCILAALMKWAGRAPVEGAAGGRGRASGARLKRMDERELMRKLLVLLRAAHQTPPWRSTRMCQRPRLHEIMAAKHSAI
jgi:hypothetical protein